MIENPEKGKEYFMSYVGELQKALYRVEVEKPNKPKGFHEIDVVRTFFPVLDKNNLGGTAKSENLFDRFDEALKHFQDNSGYSDEEIIIGIFDIQSAITRRGIRTSYKE